MKEKIELLIADLKKSAEQRDKMNQSFFTEELVIIRLKDILKEGVQND